MERENGSSENNRDSAVMKASRFERRMAWTATIILSLCFFYIGILLPFRMATVARSLVEMGAEGRIMKLIVFLGTRSWIFPVLFIGLAVVMVAKEWIMRDKRRSIVITCLVSVVFLVLVSLFSQLMLEPFMQLIRAVG